MILADIDGGKDGEKKEKEKRKGRRRGRGRVRKGRKGEGISRTNVKLPPTRLVELLFQTLWGRSLDNADGWRPVCRILYPPLQ